MGALAIASSSPHLMRGDGLLKGWCRKNCYKVLEVYWMKANKPLKSLEASVRPVVAGDSKMLLSHFFVSHQEHHVQDDAI